MTAARGGGEVSSAPLPLLSWERLQGSISQPAVTRSKNSTLPPTLKAASPPSLPPSHTHFHASHHLLN